MRIPIDRSPEIGIPISGLCQTDEVRIMIAHDQTGFFKVEKMAQLRMKSNGIWVATIQFEGKRKTITFGRLSELEASSNSCQLNRMVDVARYGTRLPIDVATWIETLPNRIKEQLSQLGILGFYSSVITLKELFERFLSNYRSSFDIAESTKRRVENAVSRFKLLEECRLSDIEPRVPLGRRNAKPIVCDSTARILMDFNSWQRKNYATATWSRDNKVLRAIGKFAVERGYCDFNPFTSLPSKSMVNADRNQHIERDQVLSAMDYCLVSDTRLSLAMARFAGMRTPSELRTLKWEHVDLDRGQLVVLDSKKKRYRVMPIFDIVRDELNRQRSHSGDSQYVASKLFRDNSDSDNYNRIKKAIRRSGQLCWMRLRQNLRSSCENDLLEIFPERLVAEWVGHSVGVSRDHYQKQRDKTYKDAILVAREIGI